MGFKHFGYLEERLSDAKGFSLRSACMQHGLWIGPACGMIDALLWQFVQRRGNFKQALKTVKEQYDL